ncbi:hypothetical protein IAR55_001707 [Kwoniella newhampshirensis]|uniref:PIN domain-containing protein n=1 Tax=Kwoniella newhampshirensis TaxID=1651941 RepID=A0AAW0Z2V7_9TREE
MDDTPVAGPSRARRNLDSSNDIANRIVALQRKNAALLSGTSSGSSGDGLGLTSHRGVDRERSRAGLGQAAQGHNQTGNRPPSSPRRLPTSQINHHPSQSLRPPAEINQFSRGTVPISSTPRALYDPSRSAVPQPSRIDRSPRHLSDNEDRHRRRVPESQSRRGDGIAAQSSSGGLGLAGARKLFDPAVHDPLHFAPRSPVAPSAGESEAAPSSSRRLPRKPLGISGGAAEEGDRERERRKRREGSERGSVPSRKKDSDGKSKESRSSEGSESFKDHERGKGNKDAGVKPILKKIHDEIKELEQELIDKHRKMSQDPEAGISILLDRKVDSFSREARSLADDAAVWVDLIAKHKRLAEMHDHFLVTLYDPLVPSSYHQLSVKYNIPSRLWQTGFHLILERLRHAWMSNKPAALDLLTDVVYDAYRFYSELLENQALVHFRTAWIEALGDLARYRMAIASHVSEGSSVQQEKDRRKGRIDIDDESDKPPISSGASIGAEVAESWDVEDKETWRTTARDWYTMGITEKPGEGRLHHHLALLCRDVKGQEGRALHHFAKSLTVTHEYATSRESILPLFDFALQSQRSLPDATAMDLFIRLHGMLFTRIQLDDFSTVMSRYMERLEEDASLDGVSRKATITQVDWMIMGSVNLTGALQYGISSGLVRKTLAQEGAERRKAQAQMADDDGDGEEDGGGRGGVDTLVTDNPTHLPMTTSLHPEIDDIQSNDEPPPITFTYGLELTFGVLEFVLSHPNRIQGFHQVLNPYITIFLTFLCTLLRQSHVGASLVTHVPWYRLVQFVNSANIELTEEKRLATGPPLPEDWLIRGMEWVGRRVYERGFWKVKQNSRGSNGMAPQPRVGGERFQSEMDVLLANFDPAMDISEGVVEEADGTDLTDGPVAVNLRRWKRVAWAVGVMAKHVEGLEIRDGRLIVEGILEQKIKEAERKKQEEEAEEKLRAIKRREKEAMDEVELLEHMGVDMEEDIGSDDGDAELVALRHRLHELKTSAQVPSPRNAKPRKPQRHSLQVVPGFTMLIFDTNVILDSLALFRKIVEGGQWSVIVPLPVVTELDGLSKEPAPLGTNAKAAVTYLETHIRTRSLCLKIQTTKGNYLSDLLIRTEHLDDSTSSSNPNPETTARTMDDRILNIASFAKDHFVDRSGLLGMPKGEVGATKVCLVSNDRNLRLKARGRGVDVADEKELSGVLSRV